ncbi:catechol 2,3-dioxygenase [Cohnella phaseoli]|uniref:Catechol 2,3-dioxygenase n=1 Tax=Cohnella phaseoli TaxID=456490 RepID=A0A3D9IPA8_9BACL|nr:catechol 2,3-dioxygenase [Cohnella phaseoli]
MPDGQFFNGGMTIVNRSIHPETSLGRLRLRVGDLERSIRFYLDVIGFRLLDRADNTASLTVDGQTEFLLLEEIPNAVVTPERSAAGLYHFAILVPTREQLGLSLRRLVEAGIPIGQGDHLVSEALYLSDPDNNGIEIYCDRPRSQWRKDADGNYIMATDPVDIRGLLNLAGDKPWNGLPSATILGHIHLHVSDLAASRAFYCDVIGFDLVADLGRTMRACFISAGGYHHHIGFNVWAGVGASLAPANATGLAYFTIAVPDAAELERIVADLERAGCEAKRIADYVQTHDPSGIEIRLTATGG